MARRVRIYLFGVMLGCIMSYFFLKRGNHSFTFWLPTERVLADISDSLTYNSSAECFLNCYSIDKKSIQKLLTDGSVNFEKSQIKNPPKIYQVEGKSISGKKIYFKARLLKGKAEIFEIKEVDSTLSCDC